MVLMTTSWLVNGRPRQFIEMKLNSFVLDPVPFGGTRRVVAHRDGQAGLGGQAASSVFHSRTGCRWTRTIRGDQQPGRTG